MSVEVDVYVSKQNVDELKFDENYEPINGIFIDWYNGRDNGLGAEIASMVQFDEHVVLDEVVYQNIKDNMEQNLETAKQNLETHRMIFEKLIHRDEMWEEVESIREWDEQREFLEKQLEELHYLHKFMDHARVWVHVG